MKKSTEVFIPEIIDEDIFLTLEELTSACSIHTEFVIKLVEYGVIQPKGKKPQNWQFDSQALKKSRSAVRLQKDFQLNPHAVGFVLDLLDEVEELRKRLMVFEK